MARRRFLLALSAAVLAVALPLPGSISPAQAGGARKDIGREVLGPDDGWGSAEGGVTGGSTAAADHVFLVHDRNELATAVAGDEPKIVYVAGRFNADVDAAGNPLDCADYAAPGWDFDAYVKAYDPAVWTGAPTGPLEDARKASNTNQGKSVRILVGSNTPSSACRTRASAGRRSSWSRCRTSSCATSRCTTRTPASPAGTATPGRPSGTTWR